MVSLTPDPPLGPYYEPLESVTYSQYMEPIFMEDVTCTLKDFSVVCLKDSLYTWDSVNYHQGNFHQIILCLHVSKINYL